MIERLKNYEINKVYQQMLFEVSNSRPEDMLDSWAKKYISGTKDSNKVKKSLDKLKSMIKGENDTILLMDKLTDEFLIISKQITDAKASDELSNILQKL